MTYEELLLKASDLSAQLTLAEERIQAMKDEKDDYPQPGISAYAEIGPEAVVDPTATIGPNAIVLGKVGKHSIIGKNVMIEHDGEIGENTIVRDLCFVSGKVGNACIVGSGSTIYGTVEDFAFLGEGVEVASHVTVGKSSTVFPMADLQDDVLANSLVYTLTGFRQSHPEIPSWADRITFCFGDEPWARALGWTMTPQEWVDTPYREFEHSGWMTKRSYLDAQNIIMAMFGLSPKAQYIVCGPQVLEFSVCEHCEGTGQEKVPFWMEYEKALKDDPNLKPRDFLKSSKFAQWHSRVPRKTETCWYCGGKGYHVYRDRRLT